MCLQEAEFHDDDAFEAVLEQLDSQSFEKGTFNLLDIKLILLNKCDIINLLQAQILIRTRNMIPI